MSANIRILFITTEPEDQARPATTRELQTIQAALKGGRAVFQIANVYHATRLSVMEGLRHTKPEIVHFLGHGSPEGLMIEGNDRTATLVRKEWLIEVFARQPSVRLVVLNACKSVALARALADGENTALRGAVAWSDAVTDADAREFAGEFYRRLAYKDSVETAFSFARKTLDDRVANKLVLELRAAKDFSLVRLRPFVIPLASAAMFVAATVGLCIALRPGPPPGEEDQVDSPRTPFEPVPTPHVDPANVVSESTTGGSKDTTVDTGRPTDGKPSAKPSDAKYEEMHLPDPDATNKDTPLAGTSGANVSPLGDTTVKPEIPPLDPNSDVEKEGPTVDPDLGDKNDKDHVQVATTNLDIRIQTGSLNSPLFRNPINKEKIEAIAKQELLKLVRKLEKCARARGPLVRTCNRQGYEWDPLSLTLNLQGIANDKSFLKVTVVTAEDACATELNGKSVALGTAYAGQWSLIVEFKRLLMNPTSRHACLPASGGSQK